MADRAGAASLPQPVVVSMNRKGIDGKMPYNFLLRVQPLCMLGVCHSVRAYYINNVITDTCAFLTMTHLLERLQP